ncbi:ArsR/SmtB family transcription factor [Arthrobacter agilis]|uniref:ArsR/SmtB family transcription factor n=1 Tax=Arthrobacter agilis TaxID=37921 RepID=UPI0032665C3A
MSLPGCSGRPCDAPPCFQGAKCAPEGLRGDAAPSGVSRHLRVLREAGLVEVHQEAQRRMYTFARSRLPRSMTG